LRKTEPDGAVDPAGEGIGGPCRVGGVVAQERNHVTGRSETETHHLGIFGRVDEFVDRAGVEAIGRLIDILVGPSNLTSRPAGVARGSASRSAYTEPGMRRIEIGSGITQRRAGGISVWSKMKSSRAEAGDLRHDWWGERHPPGARRDVALPSAHTIV